MIEIHLFEQLAAFASCGTLSAAAEQLHISQPALSRSMKRLEDELGVNLFDRQKSRLTLNENGELTVRYARNLLMQERTMIEQIQEFDRKKRTISVGSCTPVHPLADAAGLYLKDLDGQTFLLYSQIGFWDGLCRRKMPSSRFLLQQEMDVLGELVENSAFPAFTTDYVMKRSRQETDRVIIPILDEEANVTYYCTCLKSEKARFMPVFRHFR